MQLSLNEIQAECRKASRGAGLPWGLADETGQAVAWLAERGIDALPALLDCLDAVLAGEGTGNPIRSGTEIADQAGKMAAGHVLSFSEIRQPVLLLPFIALSARLIGRPVTVTHADGAWSLSPDVVESTALREAATKPVIMAVTCRAGDVHSSPPVKSSPVKSPQARSSGAKSPPQLSRLDIDEAIWRRLQDLAHHTYVPATEQSRLLGAGAGTIDND